MEELKDSVVLAIEIVNVSQFANHLRLIFKQHGVAICGMQIKCGRSSPERIGCCEAVIENERNYNNYCDTLRRGRRANVEASVARCRGILCVQHLLLNCSGKSSSSSFLSGRVCLMKY